MKTYRKILAAVLAVLTLVSLTACGGAPGGQVSNPAPTGEEVSLGRMQGGTYTNTYAGFACTLDETWSYLTAQELQELPENVEEMLSGSEVGDSAQKLDIIADMKAESDDQLTSLNVQYTKHDAAVMLVYMAMSEEALVDSVLEGKDAMIASYKQAGIDVSSIEKVKVQFAGKEHFALHTEAAIQGVPYYTTQIFVFGKGLYGVTLTAASFMTDKTATLLGLFTAA